jgi:transcription initiation factor TFIIIB Brf1 subunit/transcription initiation factor TFIIB
MDACQHETVIEMNGELFCEECGEGVDYHTNEAEWKDQSASNSQSRCHSFPVKNQGLKRELTMKNIPDAIIQEAQKHYDKISGTQVVRGKNRNALVNHCVQKAFTCKGINYTSKETQKILDIECGSGTKWVQKDRKMNKHQRNAMKTSDYVDVILKKIHFPNEMYKEHVSKIKIFCDEIQHGSVYLSNSSPSNNAIGAIFFYLKFKNLLKRLNLDIKSYAKKNGTTDITVSKIQNHIAKVVEYAFELKNEK